MKCKWISLLSTAVVSNLLPEGEQPLKIVFHSTYGGRSHCKGLLEIATDLAKRGHHVSYAAESDNMPYLKGHDLIKKVDLGSPGYFKKELWKLPSEAFMKYRGVELTTKFQTVILKIVENAYEGDFLPLLDYINHAKPDLMVCDLLAVACQDIAKLKKLPLIIGSQAYDSVGLVSNPYVVNSIEYGPLYTKELSLIDRIKDFIGDPYQEFKHNRAFSDAISKKRVKYGVPDDSPFMGDQNYGMVVSISYIGLEIAQAIPPNIKILGPLKSSDNTKMDNISSDFVEKHRSVAYTGFGSHNILNFKETTSVLEGVLKAMDMGIIDGLIWGLGDTPRSHFPSMVTVNGRHYDVKELLDGNHPDFLFYEWAPQVPILQHQNTKLFISHAGLESAYEAIEAAIPLLTIPFFFDQPRNARKLEMMGISKTVLAITITSDKILAAITDLVTDPHHHYRPHSLKAQTHFRLHSRSPSFASDTFENYAYLAKFCRPHFPTTYPTTGPPCELNHLLPQLPATTLVVCGADIYLILTAFVILAIASTGWALARLTGQLYQTGKVKKA